MSSIGVFLIVWLIFGTLLGVLIGKWIKNNQAVNDYEPYD
jgi:uncharacterized membrane protein